MNILPKKRWHVRTKQNIARVRQDEAKAAEEEKKLNERIRLAEQEARTQLLKKKARLGAPSSSSSCEQIQATENSHINFFADIEETGGYAGGTNKEHEQEEKERQEKFEKNIGLLTYLGQSELESKGEKLWYLKSRPSASSDEEESPNTKQKSFLDPLTNMKKYLSVKERNKPDKKEAAKAQPVKRKNESSEHSPEKKMSSIEVLRAKRLQREKQEHQKAQKFIETLRKPPKDEVVIDDRLRQYNSQFNPHLAKRAQPSNR